MISNLIFDVGNVLIGYRWKNMMMDHGLSEKEALETGMRIFTSPLWNLLDLGTVPEADIIRQFTKDFPDDAEIITWFLTHGELMHVARPDVWKRVHKLKEAGYGIFLLSNYCEDLFRKHTEGASFMDDIDGMVISYEVHFVKPDEQIYHCLLGRYGLHAEECLFYDDRIENTEGAERVGIRSVTVRSKAQLLGSLDARLAAPVPPARAFPAQPSHTYPHNSPREDSGLKPLLP